MSVQAKKLFVLSYKKLVHRVRLLWHACTFNRDENNLKTNEDYFINNKQLL